MDKKTFITQLRQALSVLQKDELEDIVTEYEQHIDMKMANGLSEEEAIADFGSFGELTAEILSAYHVRADYAQGTGKEKKCFFTEERAAGKELLRHTGRTCRNVGEKAAGSVRGFGGWFLGILRFWKQKAGRVFSRLGAWWRARRQPDDAVPEGYWDEEHYNKSTEEYWDEKHYNRSLEGYWDKEHCNRKLEDTNPEGCRDEEYYDKETEEGRGRMPEMKPEAADPAGPGAGAQEQGEEELWSPVYRTAGMPGKGRGRRISRRHGQTSPGKRVLGGIQGLFQKIMDVAAACLHLGLELAAWGLCMSWNVWWIGFACLCACFGLFSLFIMGMLVVLWMQHYPLAGVTVGCLGLVLCFFSAAWFCVTLLWRKRINVSNEEMEGEQHA